MRAGRAPEVPCERVDKVCEPRAKCCWPRFTAFNAQVAELADALDSGSSAGNGVEVRILSWAPNIPKHLV